MRTLPVTERLVTFNNSFKAEDGTAKSSVSAITAENKKSEKKAKTGQVVTSALALAALVASGVAIARKPKNAGEESKAIIEKLKTEVEALKKQLAEKSSNEDLVEKYNKLFEEFNKLKEIDAEGLSEKVASLKGAIDELGNKISSNLGYQTKTVELNGHSFPLVADVLNKVEGDSKKIMENTLHSEAAKRIFGVGVGLKEIPEHGMIRIPTSEIKPYASTGGMAVVPKEIAENLAKILAGRQDMQVVATTCCA